MITAVVPLTILRRWDVQAAVQLCAAVARLAEENERLAEDLRWAHQIADASEGLAYAHQCAEQGLPVGLTMDGQLVRIVPAEVMS